MLGPLLAEARTPAMLLPFHKLCHLLQAASHRYSLNVKAVVTVLHTALLCKVKIIDDQTA
jgi:hypothetical protein